MKSASVLFFVLALFLTDNLYAQPSTNSSDYRFVPETEERTDIVHLPHIEATYPGGVSELMRFISRNLKYPETCVEAGVQSKLYLRLTIEKDGTVSLIQIRLKKDLDCFEEFEIQLKEWLDVMPKWNPAYVDGEPVACIYNLPIRIHPK